MENHTAQHRNEEAGGITQYAQAGGPETGFSVFSSRSLPAGPHRVVEPHSQNQQHLHCIGNPDGHVGTQAQTGQDIIQITSSARHCQKQKQAAQCQQKITEIIIKNHRRTPAQADGQHLTDKDHPPGDHALQNIVAGQRSQ